MSDPQLGKYSEGFASFRRILAAVSDDARVAVFTDAATEAAKYVSQGLDRTLAADELVDMATAHAVADTDTVQGIISKAFEHIEDAERVPDDIGDGRINGRGKHGQQQLPLILTLEEWLARQLPEPDCLLGKWLTTTTRAIINAPTGLGKTMLGIGLGMRMAAGVGFLHWLGVRPSVVLFIDGEMTARGLKRRLIAEVQRLGQQPAGFHALCHEDIENFQPLNTPAGQKQIEDVLKRIGRVDFIFFDNIMSLIAGDMKEEDGWRQTLPWIKSLTKRSIGQLWLHHTGHDESHGYGTKTREWQMDVVGHCRRLVQPGIDVAFQLTFTKARDRTVDNREDFEDALIKLTRHGDGTEKWSSETATHVQPLKKLQPMAQKFLDLLTESIANNNLKLDGYPATDLDGWRIHCIKRGLLDKDKPDSARTLFSKYRRELLAAERILVDGEMVRVVTAQGYQAQMF